MKRPIDFKRIAAAALSAAGRLVPFWLPDGRQEGAEWSALNPLRNDSKLGSFKVNLNSGVWKDFASDDAGGDLISLYAYLYGMDQLGAAKALAADLSINLDDAAPAPAAPAKSKADSPWVPVLPAPDDAPAPPIAHIKRGKPEATWCYRDGQGRRNSYVYRFRTADGGKETLPLVWATNAATGASEWRWMGMPVSRQLYALDQLQAMPGANVVIVEGEKCADAAAQLLPDYVCMTWAGGSNAVSKSDWAPLAGRTVAIWPDHDAAGLKAADKIAETLAALGCNVKIISLDSVQDRAGGWDVADALAEGWTPAAALNFIRANLRAVGVVKPISIPEGARAEILDDESWADALIPQNNGKLMDCRENVIYFLRDHPDWRGVLGLDDFSKQIVHRKDSPLGHKAGQIWDSNCEVELTLWLAEQRPHQLMVRSLESVSNAIKFVASKNTFHPVREYFNSLVWDGKPRIEMFLHDYATAKDSDYHRVVGRYFFINLVRRVYEPGCVMRSVMVLEGAQDKGKSTLLKRLTEPWFSDTPLKIGSPDAYLQIQGVLLYEIAELEGFSKAEATAVKAFISSTEDNFRAPYDRRNAKHGRQGIFSATTNAHEYLKDWTGNTRFWPVLCGDTIRHADVSAVRDQLLAEAVALYKAGERTYPTEDQQRELFKPEADRRMASAPVRDQIQEWLELTYVGDEVTVKQIILDCMKVQIANLNQDKGLPTQVGLYLSSLGWKKRLNASTDTATGKRGNLWIRPADVDAPANSEQIAEEIPF